MKKRIALLIMSFFCFIGITIAISWAWFLNNELVTPDVSGYSASAYFAGGDGSEENPYQIASPKHLYNLAWLQYLGVFNQPGCTDEDGKVIKDDSKSTLTQYHFVLNNDIDFEEFGWTEALPPIGTTLRPFIGFFDGKGHTVSNLITSNNFSDYVNRHPSSLSSVSDVNVIGFFGVIGEVNGMENSDKSVSNKNNMFINTYLEDTTVKTTVSSPLVGIAVGYVNGEVADIGVVDSSLNFSNNSGVSPYSTNISDYGVAGYATEDYVTQKVKSSTLIYNPTYDYAKFVNKDQGDATGWGGSIDMYSIFTRLNDIRKTYALSGTQYFYIKKNAYPDYQGNQYDINNATVTKGQSSDNYYVYNSDNSKTTYDSAIGSFNFAFRGNGEPSTFTYLNSGHQDTFYSGYKISDGTNYIKVESNRSITSTTNSAEATPFIFSTVSTSATSTSTIYTYINGTKYYLYVNNNNNISMNTNYTNWDIIYSNGMRAFNYNNRYLLFNGSDWVLSNSPDGFYISSSNSASFLSVNSNNSITNSSTATDACKWYIDNNKLYTVINGNNYYLTDSNNTLSLSQTASSARNWTITTSTFGRITLSYTYTSNYNTNTYYLRYNNSWQLSTSTSNTSLYRNIFNNSQEYSLSSTSTGMDYSYNDYTCFPLNVDEHYKPKETNTGYIIGGTRGTSASGAIRISAYSKNNNSSQNLKNYNYSTYKFTANGVYTVNSSMQIVNINDTTNSYEKYVDSKEKLESVIKGKSNGLYGLHFMDIPVSMSSIITANYAYIDKQPYTNYQFPAQSIDFNLHSKGYVNFFAGTYGSANSHGDNAFFSIHQIFRDNNYNIINIKEISQIYASNDNNAGYVYKYSDGKYSAPFTYDLLGNRIYSDGYGEYDFLNSKPSGYSTLLFDTVVLGANASLPSYRYNAFYFEIPMNDGEFALGSVADPNGVITDDTISGAYLMYLDISANAQQIERTKITQKSVNTLETFAYVTGIAIISSKEDVVADTSKLDPKNSAVIKIAQGTTGNITISRSGDTITTTTDQNLGSSYVGLGVTLQNGSTPISASCVGSPVSIITKHLQFVDYNTATDEVWYTDIIKVGDNAQTYAIIGPDEPTNEWNLYDDDGNIISDVDDIEIDVTGCINQLYDYWYMYGSEATVTEAIVIDTEETAFATEGIHKYSVTGNSVSISTTETFTVHVVTKSESYVLKINGTAKNRNSTEEISAS